MQTVDVDTPHGAARVHVDADPAPVGLLVLGHGAGGGVDAPDLRAAAAAARGRRWTVVLVEQPYRVAGRRAPAPAPRLDAAWRAVIDALAHLRPPGARLVTGGRSSGARVACRTAADTGADAVLCLAFPLQPPPRRAPAQPSQRPQPSRHGELDVVTVPVLVVQGDRDPFGMPQPAASRRVVVVGGDHSLRGQAQAVRQAVGEWLDEIGR